MHNLPVNIGQAEIAAGVPVDQFFVVDAQNVQQGGVQIMDGDVIRRIRQHKDYIGHVHTAGNPGRGELDDKQEINYKPIMEALVEVGYKGYVGQEFIPTRDPLQGLREAVAVCDV